MYVLGLTIHTIGEIMVGFTAIMVHHRFWKEHKVDTRVFEEMRRERGIGLIGIGLIVIGFVIQLASFTNP